MFSENDEKTITIPGGEYSDSILFSALGHVYGILAKTVQLAELPNSVHSTNLAGWGWLSPPHSNVVAMLGKRAKLITPPATLDSRDRHFWLVNSLGGTSAHHSYPCALGALPYIPVDGLRSIVDDSPSKPAKAIKKWLYDTYGINTDQRDLEMLGNVFAAHLSGEITLKLTFGCEGEVHEYYHKGSCWWAEYGQSRDWLEQNGGGAIRAYRSGKLVGRVWFIPYAHGTTEGIILFNAYGQDSLQHVDVWGNLVATAWEVQMVMGNFYPSTCNSEMYVNSSTSALVGTIAASERTSSRPAFHVNLKTPEPVYGHEQCTCPWCEESYNLDDLTYVDGYGDICEGCLEHNFVYSEYCENYIPCDSAQYSNRMGDWIPNNDAVYIVTSSRKGCDYILFNDAIKIGKLWYARDDQGDTWDSCSICGEDFPANEIGHDDDGEPICCDCHEGEQAEDCEHAA